MKLTDITNSLSSLIDNDESKLNSNRFGLDDNQLTKTDGSFSDILKKSLNEVNNTQVSAYNAMNDIATGKVENLQEAMQKIQEAELSLKLGLEVKNKALGAYKQVMNMQV